MTSVIITTEPKESQQLYEFILNSRDKMPPIHRIKDMKLTAKQLQDVYEIVATNRAKTRGTRLHFTINEDGDVTYLEYEEVIVKPNTIITPRFRVCDCGKQYENHMDNCPKCGKENPRLRLRLNFSANNNGR